jgi:hypothetical protein
MKKNHMKHAPIAIPATAAPTPIPACAPADRYDEPVVPFAGTDAPSSLAIGNRETELVEDSGLLSFAMIKGSPDGVKRGSSDDAQATV